MTTPPHSDNPVVNPPNESGQPSDTGYIIVRLERAHAGDISDLRELVANVGLSAFAEFLTEHSGLVAERVIRHAAPGVILERERDGVQSDFPPLETLTAFWRIDARGHDAEALRARLDDMPGVAIAYHETGVTNPSAAPQGVDSNPYAVDEHYLEASPRGLGVRAAWAKGVTGAGVKLADVEAAWILDHEDLPGPRLEYGDNGRSTGYDNGDHGAAALGVVGGVDNHIGVIGIAPGVTSLSAFSRYDAASGQDMHVADAIVAATQFLDPGDVLLLEVQRGAGLPTETDAADLHAIRQAVAHGIIVIEAAGNGEKNLDAWEDPTGQHSLNPADPRFVDSGAIMVGSSKAAVTADKTGEGHARYYTSNYGARVNVYAWGQQLYTAGYGTLAGTHGCTDSYTNNFGQTSGASAVIAAAAVLLQSWYKSNHGHPMSPGGMRTLLENPETGTRQVMGQDPKPIGVMPDLAAILA